uniref:fibrinogen alpha chain-like n=1 Tax=Epinephelus lanceolatus TaxID=310571 RepID=UPI0014469677
NFTSSISQSARLCVITVLIYPCPLPPPGHDNNYFDLAQSLRQRITDMKIKIDRQLSVLAALKDRVKDQVVEMQRLEVDIDIKLRSCKGSCQSYSEYNVDKDSYVELDKQVSFELALNWI